MSKTKKINILFSIIYYLFGIIGFYLWFILAILSSFYESNILFFIIYVLLPIIILLLPIILKKIIKKEFYKCILFSLVGVAIYFISFSIYLSRIKMFDEERWKSQEYIDLRYLMIEDLEKKYNLIGMRKNDVIKILGETSNENELCYKIKSAMISSYFYCLKYDENNIITETYEKYID